MPLTHYQVLQVTPAATTEDIKRAYKREALAWHPDRRKDDPKAHRRFIAIRAAYDVLSDPYRRAQYDAVLKQRAAARQGVPQWARQPPPRRPEPRPSAPYQRRQPTSRNWPAGLIVMLVFGLIRFLSTESCESRRATNWRPARPNTAVLFDTASPEPEVFFPEAAPFQSGGADTAGRAR